MTYIHVLSVLIKSPEGMESRFLRFPVHRLIKQIYFIQYDNATHRELLL